MLTERRRLALLCLFCGSLLTILVFSRNSSELEDLRVGDDRATASVRPQRNGSADESSRNTNDASNRGFFLPEVNTASHTEELLAGEAANHREYVDSSAGLGDPAPDGWSLGATRLTVAPDAAYRFDSDSQSVWSGTASVRISSIIQREMRDTGGVYQICNASPFKGKRIRFSGMLRVMKSDSESDAAGMVWLRADDRNGRVLSFTNSSRGAVFDSGHWAEASVEVYVPDSAYTIHYGVSLLGNGKLWADETQIEVVASPTIEPESGYDQVRINRIPRIENIQSTPFNMGFESLTYRD
ncbi:MAG: hypothetical protein AAGI88_02400 [Pseudomonadota bacterium]